MLLLSLFSKQAEKEINFFQLNEFNINIDTNQIYRIEDWNIFFYLASYSAIFFVQAKFVYSLSSFILWEVKPHSKT